MTIGMIFEKTENIYEFN